MSFDLPNGTKVLVVNNLIKLRSLIDESGDLEWDDSYLSTPGAVGTVVGTDEDGTIAVEIEGVPEVEGDQLFYPREALECANDDQQLTNSICSNTNVIIPPSVSNNSSMRRINSITELAESRLLSSCIGMGFLAALVGYEWTIFTKQFLLIQYQSDKTHRSDVLTSSQQVTLWGVTYSLAILSSLVSGYLIQKGRKCTALTAISLYSVGTVVGAGSNGMGTLLCGQILIGFSLGMLLTAPAAYLSEVMLERGKGIAGLITMIHLGSTAATVNTLCFKGAAVDGGWRWLLGLVGIPCCLLYVLMCRLPESPIYLVRKGQVDDAIKNLKKLSNTHSARLILDSALSISQDYPAGSNRIGLRKFVRKNKELIAVSLLMMCMAETARTILEIYTPILLSRLLWNEPTTRSSVLYSNLVTILVAVIGSLLGFLIVEKLPRRRLLFASCAVTCVLGLASALILYLGQSGIVAMLMLISILVHSVGYGIVPLLYTCEIFPLQYREHGIAFSVIGYWVSKMAVRLACSPDVSDKNIVAFLFSVAVVSFFTCNIAYYMAAETRGLTIAHCSKNLTQIGRPRSMSLSATGTQLIEGESGNGDDEPHESTSPAETSQLFVSNNISPLSATSRESPHLSHTVPKKRKQNKGNSLSSSFATNGGEEMIATTSV